MQMMLIKLAAGCRQMQIDPRLSPMHKNQLQMDRRTQNNAGYSEADRRERGNSLKLIDIGKDFLNRKLITQVARKILK